MSQPNFTTKEVKKEMKPKTNRRRQSRLELSIIENRKREKSIKLKVNSLINKIYKPLAMLRKTEYSNYSHLQGIGSRTPSDNKIHDAQVPYIKWVVFAHPPVYFKSPLHYF